MAAFEMALATGGDDAAGYRAGSGTACPDCGKSHWLIGRCTAECAACAGALPIERPVWQTVIVSAPSGFRYSSTSRR